MTNIMKKNKQIIVTVGVPASGKTTWAKNFVKENPSYVKIERKRNKVAVIIKNTTLSSSN